MSPEPASAERCERCRPVVDAMLPVVAAAEAWFDCGRSRPAAEALARAIAIAKADAFLDMQNGEQ